MNTKIKLTKDTECSTDCQQKSREINQLSGAITISEMVVRSALSSVVVLILKMDKIIFVKVNEKN